MMNFGTSFHLTSLPISMEEPPKRRRRSGWDTPAEPSEVPSSVPPTQLAAVPPSIAISGQYLAQPALQASISPLLLAAQLRQTVPAMVPSSPFDCRIYVGSLHYELGQAEIMALFSCFGTITKFDLSHDPATGRSKGYCFIEYSTPEAAQAAVSMDGFEIANRKIKVGRPLNGIGAPAQVPSPFLASAQLSNMKFTLDSVTPSLTVPAQNLTVSSLPPPAALTPAQQIARDRAQALLTKLGQSAGIVPLAGSASNKQSKTIRIKNIRSELGLTEIEAIFSAFGAIVSSSFTGEIKSTSAGVSAREALIEFETATSATDAVSMHGTDLVGLILSVELQSAAASAASSSDTKVVSSSAEAYSSFRALKLENLVTSVDEIFEDDFQEDIIEEASRYGPLETPELRVNVGDADVTKLTRDLFLSLGLTATHEAIAVYLQFQDCSGASKAYKAMNGRHFAGQTIKATLCNFDS